MALPPARPNLQNALTSKLRRQLRLQFKPQIVPRYGRQARFVKIDKSFDRRVNGLENGLLGREQQSKSRVGPGGLRDKCQLFGPDDLRPDCQAVLRLNSGFDVDAQTDVLSRLCR